MYHPTIVAARQRKLEQTLKESLPQGLLRRPVAECHARKQDLDRIYNPDTREGTRPFSQTEQEFILHEQLLCKIDYRYAAERYIYINYEGQSLRPMSPLWESQEIILQALARLELSRFETGHPDGLFANILKGRQLGACLSPDTRVLTADLRWVPLDTIEPGDELVAVDEQPPGGRGAGRRMRTAVTEARHDVFEAAFDLILDTGVHVVATAPHRFLARKRGQSETVWRPVAQTRVGDVIRYATTPWGAAAVEDGWMGGMLDGEGSGGAKGSGGAEFNVSQVYGPVYDRLTAYFRDRGYASFHEDPPDLRLPGTSGKLGERPVGKISVARMDELFRLIGQTRPTRFIGRRWWEGKELPGKRSGFGWARVVEIIPLGVQRMIDLQTSTKTFIAEGLVSHNSTLCQSLLAHRVLTHGHVRTLIASDVPQNSGSEGLFGMLELVVEQWPWWLKPRELYHTKNKHIMWKNGSRVVVESGKSMKGGLQEEGGEKGNLARSKTYSAAHLSEITTWERPEQINNSLLPAMPITPRTLGLRESTAMGRNNYWHTEWNLAAAGEDPRFVNIFVPWYAEKTKYWLPTPPGWIPLDDTLAFARRASEYGPRYLHHPVSLSKEQLYWYELNKRAATKREELYKFLSEYPSEPEEAFQNSGRSIFSLETQARVANQARPLIDLWIVKPHAELVADKEASLAEFRESQRQVVEAQATQRTRSQSRTLSGNEPQTLAEETPVLTEIEPEVPV